MDGMVAVKFILYIKPYTLRHIFRIQICVYKHSSCFLLVNVTSFQFKCSRTIMPYYLEMHFEICLV